MLKKINLIFSIFLVFFTYSFAWCDSINSIPNFRKIDENIYAGGRLEEKDIAQLVSLGIKTIVNLESGFFIEKPKQVEKEQLWVEKAGIRYFKVPMNPIDDPEERDIALALNLITNPQNQPVFIHCKYGKDRTGIVVATYRLEINKWKLEQAYQEMKAYGFHWFFFWWKDIFEDMREHKNWRKIK